jgi:hypothetical protein
LPQQPVGAHETWRGAGLVFDKQVIADAVERIGIDAANLIGGFRVRAAFLIEDVPAQPLGGFDVGVVSRETD